VAAQVLVQLGADLSRVREQVTQLLTGRLAAESAPAIAEDLRKRLASMASRLAVIERKLGETAAEG
jgi:hypothetical protein